MSGIDWITAKGIGPFGWDAVAAVGTWLLAICTLILVMATRRIAKDQADTLRNESRVRLTVERRDRWESPEMISHRIPLAKLAINARNRNIPVAGIDHHVLAFFEGIGVLLRKGALDTDLVRALLSYVAKRYWAVLEDYVRQDQQNHPGADLWCEFGYLVQELGGPLPTKDEIQVFLTEEVSLHS